MAIITAPDAPLRGVLRAVIDQARRHMNRRRLRLALLVMIVLAGTGTIAATIAPSTRTSPKSKSNGSSSVAFALATLPDIQLMGLIAPGEGWAANGLNIYFTHDNGRHWSVALPAPVSGDLLNGLDGFASIGHNNYWFASYQRSYGTCHHFEPPNVAGSTDVTYPFVSFTKNGGTTWQRTTLPQCGVVTGIDFLNANHGWAFVANNAVSTSFSESVDATDDGGAHWHPVGTVPMSASIEFSTAKVGWATAVTGDSAYATTNGGATWRAFALPIPIPYRSDGKVSLAPPKFFGPKTGVIAAEISDSAGSIAVVYQTSDAGKHWETHVLPDHPFSTNEILVGQLPVIDPFDATGPNSWIYNLGLKLFKTADGGRTWSSSLPKAPWAENATTLLDFASPTDGWAIQWAGSAAVAFLKTSNGGRTWTSLANVSGP